LETKDSCFNFVFDMFPDSCVCSIVELFYCACSIWSSFTPKLHRHCANYSRSVQLAEKNLKLDTVSQEVWKNQWDFGEFHGDLEFFLRWWSLLEENIRFWLGSQYHWSNLHVRVFVATSIMQEVTSFDDESLGSSSPSRDCFLWVCSSNYPPTHLSP
jgi:hypothetical protein